MAFIFPTKTWCFLQNFDPQMLRQSSVAVSDTHGFFIKRVFFAYKCQKFLLFKQFVNTIVLYNPFDSFGNFSVYISLLFYFMFTCHAANGKCRNGWLRKVVYPKIKWIPPIFSCSSLVLCCSISWQSFKKWQILRY